MIVTDLEMEKRVMATLPLKNLPLGFRFHPKDEELVNHYLKGKIDGRIRNEVEVIPVIDVCKCEPWDLPDKSLIRSDDPEWFFFGTKDRKYSNGHRFNRATEAGYWKATGKDRTIRSRSSIVGMKKTLVFHRGRAPKGTRTSWIMHEYRTTEPEYESGEQGGYVLYRLFKKPDDKSLSSNSDVVEGSGFSPAPSRSPGDTHHEADMLIVIPLKQASSESDSRELKPFLSSDKMHTGIKRWHNDRSDWSTTKSVKHEGSLCDGIINSNALHHEAELGLKVDNIGGMLAPKSDMQVELLGSDGFPDIGSRYQNYPSSSNVNQGPQMGLHPDDDSVEHDSLDELLSAMLGNQEDSCSGGSMLQKDSFAEMPPEGDASNVQPFFWDSPSVMESMWVDDLGTDTGVVQGGGWPCTSPASFNRYADPAHEFVNPCEWADLLPYNNVGPDVLSVDSTNESLHEFPSCMEDQGNGKNTGSNGVCFENTGIKIITREPQFLESSNNLVTHQGQASKRIRLQCKLESGPFSMGSTDQEGQVAAAEEGAQSSVERGEELALAPLDKLEDLSVHEDSDSTLLGEKYHEPKPTLRPRRKINDENGHDHKAPTLNENTSKKVSPLPFILVVILLILLVRIWKLTSFQ